MTLGLPLYIYNYIYNILYYVLFRSAEKSLRIHELGQSTELHGQIG